MDVQTLWLWMCPCPMVSKENYRVRLQLQSRIYVFLCACQGRLTNDSSWVINMTHFLAVDSKTNSNNASECFAATFKHFNEFGCQAASRNSNRDNQLGRHRKRYFRYGLSFSRSYQGKTLVRIPMVKLKIPWKRFLKSGYRTSVTFKS